MSEYQPIDHLVNAFSLSPFECEAFSALLSGGDWSPAYATPALMLLTEEGASGRAVHRRIQTFLACPSLPPQYPDIEMFYPEMGTEDLFFAPEDTEPLLRLVRHAKEQDGLYLICVYGGSGKRSLIRYAAGRNALSVLYTKLPGNDEEIARIKLETILMGAAICFTDVVFDGKSDLTTLLNRLYPAVKIVFFTSGKPLPDVGGRYLLMNFPVPVGDAAKRQKIWERMSGEFPVAEDVKQLPDGFALSAGRMKSALTASFAEAIASGASEITKEMFREACRNEHAGNLRAYGTIVKPVYGLDDIVLPAAQREQFISILNRLRNSDRVYNQWGFAEKMPYGAGLKLLLAGPPATGKTMSAIVLATELALPLLKVDSASVTSKYIGETEKNLRRIFDAASENRCILLFDEADSLFGKRTETRDSHDRYANLQTSFLLQKIEEYNGTVILTTNLQQNFDEAFRRRFHYIVQFTLPDVPERKQLWENAFPGNAPVESGIDTDFLAETFSLSGGNIKNTVLAAAFYAAEKGERIGMSHILRALREECEKMGNPVSKQQFMAWGE